MRQAAKRDANEPEIIAALERVGAVVSQISDAGALDLIVGFRGDLSWIEVKDGAKSASRRKLKTGQVETLAKFAGYRVGVVKSVDEALRFVGAIN